MRRCLVKRSVSAVSAGDFLALAALCENVREVLPPPSPFLFHLNKSLLSSSKASCCCHHYICAFFPFRQTILKQICITALARSFIHLSLIHASLLLQGDWTDITEPVSRHGGG